MGVAAGLECLFVLQLVDLVRIAVVVVDEFGALAFEFEEFLLRFQELLTALGVDDQGLGGAVDGDDLDVRCLILVVLGGKADPESESAPRS